MRKRRLLELIVSWAIGGFVGYNLIVAQVSSEQHNVEALGIFGVIYIAGMLLHWSIFGHNFVFSGKTKKS